jgi:hypothetical protein
MKIVPFEAASMLHFSKFHQSVDKAWWKRQTVSVGGMSVTI